MKIENEELCGARAEGKGAAQQAARIEKVGAKLQNGEITLLTVPVA